MDLYHYHHFFQNRTPMPSFGPLNKFAQDEKVEVEHVLEQCELCLGELSTFGFFLVLDFSGVKEKRFDGFIIVWLCESPIFGWFTFPFSENSPVILWMKSTFLGDFSNNFCFLTYCARKFSKLLSLTAPLEEVSDRQRRLDAPLAKFVGLVG